MGSFCVEAADARTCVGGFLLVLVTRGVKLEAGVENTTVLSFWEVWWLRRFLWP